MEIKALTLDMEAKREKVAKFEAQSFKVKTNQEYRALQTEIASAAADASVVEDKILECMVKADEGRKSQKENEAEAERLAGEIRSEEERIGREIAEIEGRLDELRAERLRIAEKAEKKVLSRYERIFRNRRDCAVVPVVNGTCGGCHMNLTSNQINEVRRGEQVKFCESCARILYYTEEEA